METQFIDFYGNADGNGLYFHRRPFYMQAQRASEETVQKSIRAQLSHSTIRPIAHSVLISWWPVSQRWTDDDGGEQSPSPSRGHGVGDWGRTGGPPESVKQRWRSRRRSPPPRRPRRRWRRGSGRWWTPTTSLPSGRRSTSCEPRARCPLPFLP